jgi:hypothetical protein
LRSYAQRVELIDPTCRERRVDELAADVDEPRGVEAVDRRVDVDRLALGAGYVARQLRARPRCIGVVEQLEDYDAFDAGTIKARL